MYVRETPSLKSVDKYLDNENVSFSAKIRHISDYIDQEKMSSEKKKEFLNKYRDRIVDITIDEVRRIIFESLDIEFDLFKNEVVKAMELPERIDVFDYGRLEPVKKEFLEIARDFSKLDKIDDSKTRYRGMAESVLKIDDEMPLWMFGEVSSNRVARNALYVTEVISNRIGKQKESPTKK